MTIPKLTPYIGQVANPDGSQTQTEFTQNMFDQLSYEAQLATQLDATIDGMNNAVDEVEANATSAQNSANAAEAAAASAGYQGLWPDTGGSALKGEIWQTQVGGTPTGEYYTALQDTSVDPVGDNVNWKVQNDLNTGNLSNYTDIVYKASGGNSAIENMLAGVPVAANVGDVVRAGGTLLTKISDGNPDSLLNFRLKSKPLAEDFKLGLTGDWGDAIMLAYSRFKSPVVIPNFEIEANITSAEGIMIEGSGSESKIRGSIVSNGLVTVLPSVASNIIEGTLDIEFASSPSLEPGDTICIQNTVDGSFMGSRSYYRNGEFRRVFDVVGNVVTCSGSSLESYDISDIVVYKINSSPVFLKNFNFEQVGQGSGIKIKYSINPRVMNVLSSGSGTSTLEFKGCVGVSIKQVSSDCYSAAASQEYGISLINCQNVNIDGGDYSSERHGVAIGGDDELISVPCRDIRINESNISTTSSTGIAAADVHGNCSNIIYRGCTINGAISFAGEDVSYVDCHVYSSPDAGSNPYFIRGSEIAGGRFRVSGCKFISNRNSNDFSFPFFIGKTGEFDQNLRSALSIVIEDISIKMDADLGPFYIEQVNNTHPVSVSISNIEYIGKKKNLLTIDAQSGVDMKSVTISDIRGNIAGYLSSSSDIGATTYLRMPKIKGQSTLFFPANFANSQEYVVNLAPARTFHRSPDVIVTPSETQSIPVVLTASPGDNWYTFKLRGYNASGGDTTVGRNVVVNWEASADSRYTL